MTSSGSISITCVSRKLLGRIIVNKLNDHFISNNTHVNVETAEKLSVFLLFILCTLNLSRLSEQCRLERSNVVVVICLSSFL